MCSDDIHHQFKINQNLPENAFAFDIEFEFNKLFFSFGWSEVRILKDL